MTGATPWMAFGIMAVSVAGAALCWYLAHNSEGHANYRMCAEKRIHIGERMKYMPMGYFNAQSLGSLTAAATSTMEDLESMSFAVIARTVVGMIRTTIFSLAILCFDWRIGLVFLLGMLLFLWVNSLLLKKSRELSPGRLAAQTRLVDAVLEYIQGMSVVRAFHGDKAANQTLNRTIEETEQQNFKLERKRIPYNVLEQIVLRVTAVAAILFSIWFFLQGSMTLFTCLMVVVSAFLVYSELESAGEMFFMLPMIDASIDRVEEIDRAPRMDEGGSVQTPKHCDISFEHVDFSYGERKIIRDVSFTIPEGTTTAIVGPSGSGKTKMCIRDSITIGGAAGTRVSDNWGQRILTIALAWAVPCAATWAIVPMISSVFFGVWAPLVIVGIFLVALLHMWLTSKVFGRQLVKAEDRTGIIMELPPYHRPKWGSLLRYVFGRTKDVLVRALKVILLISLIFWLLSYSSDGDVTASVIYKIGAAIEPVTRIFGLSWQTFLAFISSAVSKEAALGVLSSLYAGTGTIFASTVCAAGQAANLGEILAANISPAEALAFIFAVTFNIPCVVAVASTYNETHSAKWTVRIAIYYICVALLMSFVVYHVAALFL